MRALLLAAVASAAVASLPARGAWTLLDKYGDASQAADFSTLRINGSLRRVWIRYDYKEQSGSQSMKVYHELDCKEERGRRLHIVMYSGSQATGQVVGTVSEPSGWTFIAPDTFGRSMLESICSYRP